MVMKNKGRPVMAITALDIKDKQFTTNFVDIMSKVDEFLDIIVDDYEDLVHDNRELAARVKKSLKKNWLILMK